jgi:hypothetical protein
LGLGFLGHEVLLDVGVSFSQEASHLFFIVCIGHGFGHLSGICGSLGVGNVNSFSGPSSKGAIVSWGHLGNVVLEVCLDEFNMRIDLGLNVCVFIKDLVID